MNQTPEEREAYKTNVQPLFKIKRVILETTQIQADDIVVNKNAKKVYIVQEHDLREVAEMKSKRNIIWAGGIEECVKERYNLLTS